MDSATGFGGSLLAWAVGLSVLGGPGQAPQPLPDTSLPLKLLGVMADTAAPSRSTCLIRCAYPIEAVGTFGPGQTACDVAGVREIGADFVIINNLLTNRLERLAFRNTDSPANAASPANEQVAANAESLASPPVLKRSQDAVTVELPEASVRHYLDNLPTLLDSALATPKYRASDGGPWSIEGFELSRIRGGSVVEQMGFQNGDVIVELNGRKLDSLATVIALFGQVQTMQQATLIVLRNGRRMTFIFNRT